ncbi:GGDEF-domain containing protein [Marinomonas piezotolerans]|uniref:GGDEF-domain containing protein n=1 Tax=Marinomonas piezotolerans TaxID=2213058 RepID=A0A370UC20_9GAMM|nr:EAL domain-containing protein [Marinomonas piezotolerans]RDL45357.1 GGDEF-domain containing protein [Marinomonas piezotolerans]
MSSLNVSQSERNDAIDILYANISAGLVSTFIAASVLVYVFDHQGVVRTLQYAWLAVFISILVLRLVDIVYFYRRVRHSSNHFDYGRAFTRFSIGILLTATLWAVYAIALLPYTTVTELAAISIVISAFAGGSANILSGSRRVSLTYSLILTLPYSIALLLSDSVFHNQIGLLAVTFSIIMAISVNKAAKFTSHAIHLKHQNDHLLKHMEQEVSKRTKEIYALSNIDPLTGLYNRKAFVEKLDYRLQTQPSNELAILFIDLDSFKTINDSLGHEVGDIVITDAANRISRSSHSQDLICRWGGDEFLIAIDLNDNSLIRAQHLIDQISEPYHIDGSKLQIGATIGVAYYPAHGNDHERLIQRADMAMYDQKRNEKGKVGLFNESLREQLLREIHLRDHLENAIHRHELFLMYQPIIETNSDKIVAVEALLRWQLDTELIPPDEFVSIAEQYGLIKPIGLWVLGEACMAGKRLQALSPELAVCVNVSIQQLLDDHFPNDVSVILKQTGLEANRLMLEITESLFAHDKRRLIDNINRLKASGVQVSIDDFGTGYSSLSSMQEFDVDCVKIDRSFIWSMDKGGLAIVEAVTQIARSFDYYVVAEGVETEAQRRILSELNIKYIQGFLFSKPLSEEELTLRLS